MSETLTYKLQTDMQTFEGPLDLLLHLIAKNKMDIFQIQITVILRSICSISIKCGK